MSNKLDKVIIENENGETAEVAIADYKKHIIKEHGVKEIESPQGPVPADKIVDHIVKSITQGKEVDETIASELPDLVSLITADIERTKNSKVDKKAEAAKKKAEKEAAKKEEEEKKAAEAAVIQQKQENFVSNVAAGADLAEGEFASEVLQIKESLPSGITVSQKGTGYALEIGEGVTQETIGQTMGYLAQKSINSQFIGNQLYFWLGDITSATVEKGIYATAKDAAKAIAKLLLDKFGKRLPVENIEAFKRMSERTPVELRNPRADVSAYLEVSKIKVPRKGDNEKEEAYEKRLKKFEKDRKGLQEKLSKGEVTKNKDIKPLVNELAYAHGLKERPSGEKEITLAQRLMTFFHASVALNELVGVHKDHQDAAVYAEGERLYPVSREELERIRDEAYANAVNVLYTSKTLAPKDFFRGYSEKTVEVEVGKDQDGKPIKQPNKTKSPAYPLPFFDIPEEEESEADETPTV